jgi:GNAT superfamily N-acetyltransferase
MADFLIRPARIDDAEAVTEVLTASYTTLLSGHYKPDVLAAALPMMTKANPTLLRCGTYYLAEMDGGRVASVGGWTRERPGTGEITPGDAHLRHFGTHPDFAGRGLAGALVRHCLDEARQHGILRMHCDSTLPAKGFYENLGFRSVATVTVTLKPGVTIPSMRMMMSLQSGSA